MAAGADIPHDLVHFVIEAELGIDRGFWGCIADGATFGFRKRKKTRAGRDILNDYAAELAEAERVVNEMHFAWRRGLRVECQPQLDATLQQWTALSDEEELALHWPVPTARDRRTAPRARAGSHRRRT